MLTNFLALFSDNDNPVNTGRRVVVNIFSLVVVSFAWWLIIVSILFGNQFGVYAVRGLEKGIIVLPVVCITAVLLARKIVIPKFSEISQKGLRYFLIPCAVLSLLISFWFPFAVPALTQQNTLQLISIGENNEGSQAAMIEIRGAKFLDGTPVPLKEFSLSGGWQIHDGKLLSTGEDGFSLAEWSGQMPAGIVLSVRHNLDAGEMSINWNGTQTDYDLFASQSVTADIVLRGESASWTSLQGLVSGFVQLFYFIGLLSFLFIFALIVELRWPKPGIVYLVIGLLYAALFFIFVREKLAYLEFSAIRVFRDTISYAETAGEPWNSLRFWAGYRSFAYPFILKLFGINAQNYTDAIRNANVAQFQYWFSISSWTALGAALSFRVRKLWLMPIAFGMVLFFSLNLEISIWESLILTESISFSLFALLLALWAIWDLPFEFLGKPVLRVSTLIILVVVTVFYMFTRESNQYFVLFGAVIFPIASFFGKASRQKRTDYLIYLVIFMVILITKSIAFNVSNIWQIHIYDHLALRLLPDDEAREYFEAAGLPVDQNLMQITTMDGYEYQDYLANHSEMEHVREWIDQSGVATYMQYLLSKPISSMLEPIRQFPSLLGGNNLEYHAPLYGVSTIPHWLHNFTSKVYPRSPLAFLSILGMSIVGVWWYVSSDLNQSSWVVIGILLVSLYPMLFIIWHGNPMEIERHAAQIGVQFRFMGWMAGLFLLDHLSLGEIVILPNRNKNMNLLLHQLQE